MVRIFGSFPLKSNERHYLRASVWPEPCCQFSPADFSALVNRNFVDEKDPLGNLPTTQPPPAKLEQRGLLNCFTGCDTRRYLFVSPGRFPAEHDRSSHAGIPQQLSLDLGGVYFLPRDIDHIRDPANDSKSFATRCQEIVRGEEATAQSFIVGVGKITVARCGCANSDPAWTGAGFEKIRISSIHRSADKSRFFEARFAVVANAAALRRAIKRMDPAAKLLPEFTRDFEW